MKSQIINKQKLWVKNRMKKLHLKSDKFVIFPKIWRSRNYDRRELTFRHGQSSSLSRLPEAEVFYGFSACSANRGVTGKVQFTSKARIQVACKCSWCGWLSICLQTQWRERERERTSEWERKRERMREREYSREVHVSI